MKTRAVTQLGAVLLLFQIAASQSIAQALLPATPYAINTSAEQSRVFSFGIEHRKLAFTASRELDDGWFYLLQATYRPLKRWGKEPFIEDEDISFGVAMGKVVRIETFEFSAAVGADYQSFKVASKPRELSPKPIPPDSFRGTFHMPYVGSNYESFGDFVSMQVTLSVRHEKLPIALYSQFKPAYVIQGSYTTIHNYDSGQGWTYGHVTYTDTFRDQLVVGLYSGVQLDWKALYLRLGVGQLVFSDTPGPFPIVPSAQHLSLGGMYRF